MTVGTVVASSWAIMKPNKCLFAVAFLVNSTLTGCAATQERELATTMTWEPVAVDGTLPEKQPVEAVAVANKAVANDPMAASVALQLEGELSDVCGHTRPRVLFSYDSAELTGRQQSNLDELAECIEEQRLADDAFVVVGHADPRGSEQYNYELGLARARSVSQLLTTSGLDEHQIEVMSRGESMASEKPELWPQDRRVVIRLARNFTQPQ